MPTDSEYLELIGRIEQLECKVAALAQATPGYGEFAMLSDSIADKAEDLVEKLGGTCTPWHLDRDLGGYRTWRSHVIPPGSDWASSFGVDIPTGTFALGSDAWTIVEAEITRFFKESGGAE